MNTFCLIRNTVMKITGEAVWLAEGMVLVVIDDVENLHITGFPWSRVPQTISSIRRPPL